MNGEYPLAIFVELSECTDPAAEDEVARWIGEQHLPDLLASGWVLEEGRVYRRLPANGTPEQGRFLTISTIDRWDMDSITDVLEGELDPQWRAAGRLDERFSSIWRDCHRLCGPTMRPNTSPFVTERTGSAPVTAVMMLQATCPRIDENQLNDWYNRVRVPEMLAQGPFHTAYRYASCSYTEPARRFLQIFETDAANPAAEIERFLDEWRPASPAPPFLEELGTSVFAPA